MSVTIPSIPSTSTTEQPPSVSWFRKLAARLENSDGLASLLAIFDQGMISGTNFVTAVIVGRCCGAETLGLYSLISAAIAMTVGVQDQLVTAPYVVYHNRKRGGNLRRYLGSVLIHQLAFIVVAMLCVAVGLLFVPQTNLLAKTVTVILLMATPAILLRAFIREIALAHYDVLTVVIVDASVCVTQLLIVVAMFATGTMYLPVVYCVLGIACVATTMTWMKNNRGRIQFDRQAIKFSWYRNWRFGRWALATHLAGTSTPYVMPWVLFAMKGEAETGLLASCSVIVGIANILLSGLGDFLTPRATRAYASGGIRSLKKILRSMLGLSVLAIGTVCVVAALFGNQIIDFLYDGKFANTGDMVAVLTLAVLANAFSNVAGNGLWALNKPRLNFVADMVTLTVAIATAPMLIAPYGAFGAALSTLSACTVGAICRQLIFFDVARTIESTRKDS